MKYLAFVTMEFQPLTTGEIGRVIHNMLVAMPSSDRARTVVILVGEALDLGLARATFPDVRFEGLDDVAEVGEADRYPPKNAYRHTTEWHWRSVCVLRKLLKLEQEGLAFDYVEFPDYCGLGFAATQEKLFESAFSQATLAIRLHGTVGLNLSAEAHPTDKTTLALYDIERKALRDCDKVIAPSMPVADYYRSFYGFDLSEWAPRIVPHSLPVRADNEGVAKSCVVSSDMPLLFLSNLQSAKAPDVFVRACVGFMRLCPEYAGEVHFLSQEKNPEVGVYLEKLIPSDLAHRFRLHDSPVPKAQREQLISQGVSVFSSSCESLCLAAFEASLLGGAVLLNGVNPAFSELTPWRDAVNCIKFDGTVESLLGALQRLFHEGPELAPVSPPADVMPWRVIVPSVESSGLTEGDSEAPLVSVIIPNFNLGAYLPHTLNSVASSVYPNIEIIICDDASTDPQTIELLGRLEPDFKNRSLRIVYARYNRGLAGARNLAIREARGKYVLTLDADDLVSPDFIAKAVGALERNPGHSIVVPQTAFFSQERNEVPKMQSEYLEFFAFYGEAFACGFFDNRFSTATVLARRTVFLELKYREDLRGLEDWDLYLRATIAGYRFIVTNELHFFYRRRQGSMISELHHNHLHMLACIHDLRRIQRLELGFLSFPAYVFSGWEGALVAEIRRLNDELHSVRSSGAAEIQRLSQVVAERDGQIASLGQVVAERDGQIASLGQVVAERDGQIASLGQVVAERDGQIASLGQVVAERDGQIAVFVAQHQSSRTYRLRRLLAIMRWRRALADSPLFNSEWYLQSYPDVASAGLDPLKHYLTCGWRERRRPGPEFDNVYYVARYQDIKHLDMPPLVHYWLYGRFEGRSMNAAFEVDWRPAGAVTDLAASSAVNVAIEAVGHAPLISVIIPTYNRIKLLPNVVDSWREVHAYTMIPYEIIFSDDGSEDGSAEFLESVKDLPIKVLRNTHGGASSARNAAIRFATGERLLIIGDDIFPDPEILNVHAQLGAKLGDMVATLGSVDWHEELPINHLMHHITEVGNEQFSYNRLRDGAYVDFRHFYTCNICVPRHFFTAEQVVFDERFDEYGFEDIELGYRLALRGLKIYFSTAATGEHFHPYSTANFCRRQISAGRMAVVFAGMHPGVRQLIGVTDDVRHAEAQDTLWQTRVDLLVRRCDEYEHLIASLPNDRSVGLRDCLSMLYTRLFRAMYQYGVLQKQGRSSSPLTLVMTDHFSGLRADYWAMLEAHAGELMRLPVDEACNLGEALMTGRSEDLLFDQDQRGAFDELMLIRELGVQAGGPRTPNRFRHLLSRGFHYLFRNPRYLLARIREMLAERHAAPRGVPGPVINTPLLVAIPGLVIDADDEHRVELIAASRAVFGDSLQVYELAAGGLLARLDETGRLAAPASPGDVEATVFFWPASTRFVRCPDRLLSAYMAVIENGLGMGVISHSLDTGDKVMAGAWRDHVVFSRALASAVLEGNTGGGALTGKILRLLPAWGGEQEHRLNSLLGQEVAVGEDGFFSSRAGNNLTPVRYRPHYLAAREKTKQVVFVFPIFLAVGGVERNTVEIMRGLRDRFDFVVITMERLRTEQGSLSGQAQEVAARVIEMSEIVNHGDYLRVLSRLKTNLQPDLVWVCNGSPWFCDNAAAIRRIFNDIPIIDQEAYDVEQGWINRYADPGIRSFDHFIAINKKIEARFLGDFRIAHERVHLIYSAIDTTRIRNFKAAEPREADLREKFSLPANKKLYTFVARLTPQKRPVEFLKLALRRIRHEDEFFVLVGDGELAGEAEAFIAQHGLHNLKRIPYIANTLELNAISSGIIFTSAYEGLPIAMLEALSMGVPCFSTDVGDIADVLHQYGGGDMFPVAMMADDVAVAFDAWLARHEEYVASLRTREADILERFSSGNIAEQYAACWHAAMAEYGKKPA